MPYGRTYKLITDTPRDLTTTTRGAGLAEASLPSLAIFASPITTPPPSRCTSDCA